MASQPTTCTENNSPFLLALLLTRSLFLSSLCLSPSLWPHLSLFLFHLFILCIFTTFPLFFAPEVFFSPSYSCLHSSSLFSRSSLHPRPCGPGEVAGWQKLDPLVSQVPYLAYEVLPCMCAECLRVCVCVCERGTVLEGKVRCERMMHLIHCEEKRRRSEGKEWRERLLSGRREGGRWRPGLHSLRWVRLLLDLSLVFRELRGSQWK